VRSPTPTNRRLQVRSNHLCDQKIHPVRKAPSTNFSKLQLQAQSPSPRLGRARSSIPRASLLQWPCDASRRPRAVTVVRLPCCAYWHTPRPSVDARRTPSELVDGRASCCCRRDTGRPEQSSAPGHCTTLAIRGNPVIPAQERRLAVAPSESWRPRALRLTRTCTRCRRCHNHRICSQARPSRIAMRCPVRLSLRPASPPPPAQRPALAPAPVPPPS
jgi:hypothetical protein